MRGKHHEPFCVTWVTRVDDWHLRRFSELGGVKEFVKNMEKGKFHVTLQTHYSTKPIDITDRFV